jgi:hypothetical protein
VRFRELGQILPQLAERQIHTQLVTSAVRPIPTNGRDCRRCKWSSRSTACSLNTTTPNAGDVRPDTETHRRHQVTVHCTVTRQQVRRDGYLEEFLSTWDANPQTRLIWISLYTPQKGEISASDCRRRPREVIAELRRLRPVFRSCRCSTGCCMCTRSRRPRPISACSRRRRNATRQTSNGESCRVSSAGIRTARTAGASRRPALKQSAATS